MARDVAPEAGDMARVIALGDLALNVSTLVNREWLGLDGCRMLDLSGSTGLPERICLLGLLERADLVGLGGTDFAGLLETDRPDRFECAGLGGRGILIGLDARGLMLGPSLVLVGIVVRMGERPIAVGVDCRGLFELVCGLERGWEGLDCAL